MTRKPLAVAIVADDLTGALDTAAPFASHGLDTWVTLPTASAGIDAGAEVVALTTESRHLTAAQAATRVDSAFRELAGLYPEVVFKKIDSTLRGNVGAEVVAAMAATGRRHAIIAPAVPGQNRTMRGGTVYVNGTRLLDRADSGSVEAAQSSYLPDLLRRAGALHVHLVAAGQWPTLANEPGLHAYVIDAEKEADHDAVAQFIAQQSSELLVAGAMGLGRALARVLGSDAPVQRPHVGLGVLLFVVGSRSGASAVQIEALRGAGANELEIPTAAEPGRDLRLDQLDLPGTSLLVVRPEQTAFSGASTQIVAGRLGRAAAAIVKRIGVAALVMAGGDTAAACFECLGVDCLHVLGELHDGIAFGRLQVGTQSLPFFTKSGSFGRADTWTRLAALRQLNPSRDA